MQNHASIATEVVWAINKSIDNTLEEVIKFSKSFNNVKIIEANFSYSDIGFDGKLKNFALQATTQPVKLGADLDEFFVINHRDRWYKFAEFLLSPANKDYQCLMVPMINLYGDVRKVKEEDYKKVGFKWYIHKRGLYRGIVNFAKLPNGRIDTTKSDTCELIDSNGNLVKSLGAVRMLKEGENFYDYLNNEGIFVYHTGYVDFEKTIKRNNEFWQKHWELRGGIPFDRIPLKLEDMTKFKTVEHNLDLWK